MTKLTSSINMHHANRQAYVIEHPAPLSSSTGYRSFWLNPNQTSIGLLASLSMALRGPVNLTEALFSLGEKPYIRRFSRT